MAPIVKTPVVNRSGTIAAAGQAQDVYSDSQAPRYGLEYYNTSAVRQYIDWGTTATAETGIPLDPGDAWEPPNGIVPTGKMSVFCAQAGASFVCKTF